MPDLVNKLAHGVRVTDDDGREHRLRAGEVGSFSGDAADRLTGIEGVDTASGEDKEAWEQQTRSASGLTSDAPGMTAGLEAAALAARERGRMATVALPLNTVIGDDDAPLGPPSGTITTKQAVSRKSLADRDAFSDHEHLPEDAETGKLSEVEQAQAEARAALEEMHNEVLEDAEESGVESATAEPESTSEAAATGGGEVQPPKRSRRSRSDAPAEPQS